MAAFVLGFLVFIPIGQIVDEYKVMGCILGANVSYVLSGTEVNGIEELRGIFGNSLVESLYVVISISGRTPSFVY